LVSLASLLIHFGLLMTATWSRRGEVEKEKEDSVALDTEGQRFTQVSYRDALQRASRKVTESESK
jgi:hypothetical protein